VLCKFHVNCLLTNVWDVKSLPSRPVSHGPAERRHLAHQGCSRLSRFDILSNPHHQLFKLAVIISSSPAFHFICSRCPERRDRRSTQSGCFFVFFLPYYYFPIPKRLSVTFWCLFIEPKEDFSQWEDKWNVVKHPFVVWKMAAVSERRSTVKKNEHLLPNEHWFTELIRGQGDGLRTWLILLGDEAALIGMKETFMSGLGLYGVQEVQHSDAFCWFDFNRFFRVLSNTSNSLHIPHVASLLGVSS